MAFSTAVPKCLHVGPGVHLASSLVAELAYKQQRCSLYAVSSPSRPLTEVPKFLSKTCTSKLSVSVEPEGTSATAQVDRMLRDCPSISDLICQEGFNPAHWPPHAQRIKLVYEPRYGLDSAAADAASIKAMGSQNVQLVRLQDAASLQLLKISTGIVCHWPASLRCALPVSLQTVCVKIVAEDEECIVDLSAFTAAAGCGAELHVRIMQVDYDEPMCDILRELTALPSFSSLPVDCLPQLAREEAFQALLEQVKCTRLIMTNGYNFSVTLLPAVHDLAMLPKFYPEITWPVFAWSALASPGLHCLGSATFPLKQLAVQSCNGLPGHHATPWALIIWADLSVVTGLPLECFVEEARGKHVWRNAAASDLVL